MEELVDFNCTDTTNCCVGCFVATHVVDYGTEVAIVTSDSGNVASYAG